MNPNYTINSLSYRVKMIKLKLHQEARRLRKNGFGIKTIAHKLCVSSSGVSKWCRDIILSPGQIEELERRAHDPFYGKRREAILRRKEKRREEIESLKTKGAKEIGALTKREFLLTGASLYWAEGFKKDNRLGFANSDPFMIRFFIRWLLEVCDVPREDIRLRVGLNISHRERIGEIEQYWSKLTGIPPAQFQKPFFQKFIWKKQFPKPQEYFGVLRIRANKQLPLFRKINGFIEGLRASADA